MGVILGNVLYVTRKCQYRSSGFGGSTILVKHIYGGSFPSKMPKGSEAMLFQVAGIAGFGFFTLSWSFIGNSLRVLFIV